MSTSREARISIAFVLVIACACAIYYWTTKDTADCSRLFTRRDVFETLDGTQLAARREHGQVIGYSVYGVQKVSRLSSLGLGNADLLVSVCGVTATDLFNVGSTDIDSKVCCGNVTDSADLVFSRVKGGALRIPLAVKPE